MSKFTKATKSQARLRLALIGPSGSGKTSEFGEYDLTPADFDLGVTA